MDFNDPSMISNGIDRDTIYMKIKNPNMFRSFRTGKPLDADGLILK